MFVPGGELSTLPILVIIITAAGSMESFPKQRHRNNNQTEILSFSHYRSHSPLLPFANCKGSPEFSVI